jgi:hypothetical protein
MSLDKWQRVRSYKNSIKSGQAIAIIWTIEDVLQQAKDQGTPLTLEEALEVLSLLDTEHNATIGISWDTISTTIDTVIKDREEKANVR